MAFTLTERLGHASAEVKDLKARLREKESNYQDLQQDCRFHAMKATELTDIIDARSHDEVGQQLLLKTMKNAELKVEVQELRSLLDKSNKRMETLKQQKKAHQNMLMELSGVVRAIQKLPITLDEINKPTSSSGNIREKPLREVKKKLEVMGDRWNGLLQESSLLRQEIESKDNKIQALECLFHNLNTNRMEETSENLSTYTSSDDSIKEATSKLDPFGDDLGSENEEGSVRHEACPGEDGNTEILMYTDYHCDKEEIEKKKAELVLVYNKYDKLKTEHEAAGKKISSLQQQVIEANENCENAKKKQDLRDGLLRDLIRQYKELQNDYDDAMKNISVLQEKLETTSGDSASPEDKTSVNAISDQHDDKVSSEEDPVSSNGDHPESEKLIKDGSKPDVGKTNTPAVEAGSTFELSETSSSESQAVSSTGAQAKDALSIEGLEFEFEQTNDDYKRLEDECARLEHEYENAVAKMTHIEEDLKIAKKQADGANQKCKEYERDMLDFLEQHELLEQEHASSSERTAVVEKELNVARDQAAEAQRKQKERENDLWKVIRKYKDLAEKNESAEAKIASVEQELNFTKNHANRRDLVVEYRKIEHECEDAKAKIDILERDLKYAKSEVIKSKEEAKCTRKRLAGCHFHYKKLQQQYDEALTKISVGDRELTASRKELEVMKAQEQAWTEKLVHIRESRADAEEENKRLLQENMKMKTLCKRLMVLGDNEI